MFMMIKLKLLPPFNTMKAVRDLPGLKDLVFDPIYGLVLISAPSKVNFTVQVDFLLRRPNLILSFLKIRGFNLHRL